MDRDEAKDYIQHNAALYLQHDKTGKGFICPLCGSGSGKSGTGITSKDGIHYTCWAGCFTNEDIIDIIGRKFGIDDFPAKLQRAAEEYNITLDGREPKNNRTAAGAVPSPALSAQTAQKKPVEASKQEEDYTEYYKKCAARLNDTDYPSRRGLSRSVCERFMCGYDAEWKNPQNPNSAPLTAFIIPTGKGSYVARNTDQEADKGTRYRKVGSIRIFNTRSLSTAEKPIIITEGEIDALSIMEVGGVAVGLGSTANARQLLKILETVKPSQPLIIATDNDDAGKKTGGEIADGLTALKIPFYRVNLYGTHKDANEALTADREEFSAAVASVENIEAEAKEIARKEYEQTSAAAQLQSFINGIAESVNTPAVPTGFTKLDNLLDGGLYEGLYIIGAISSLGKTTFTLQIADQLAEQNNDVLIFSLEMARTELMAKSISRLTLLDVMQNGGDIRNAKTGRGITAGQRYTGYSQTERDIINRSISEYAEYAGHLYITEGMGSIGVSQVREKVSQHISFTGKKPIVIIDYLQILAPADIRATDKQNTDKAVLELKRISRDFKTPVIAISSFNRENYSATVKMEAFKESGAIEYSSDVLIGLQLKGAGEKNFDIEVAKDKNPREVELKILKNRQGKSGKAACCCYDYYPMFNYFKEKG